MSRMKLYALDKSDYTDTLFVRVDLLEANCDGSKDFSVEISNEDSIIDYRDFSFVEDEKAIVGHIERILEAYPDYECIDAMLASVSKWVRVLTHSARANSKRRFEAQMCR